MERELDDELEVLVAILGDDIVVHDDNKSGTVNIVIKLNETIKVGKSFLEARNLDDEEDTIIVRYLPPAILSFVLPEDYPERRPPEFKIQNAWMTENEKNLIKQSLRTVCDDSPGTVILYDCVTHIQDNVLSILDVTDTLFVDSDEKLRTIEEYNNQMIKQEYDSSIHKCEICLTELLGKQFEVLSSCSHAFCHFCLGQYCETHIQDGSARSIDCPDPSCRTKVEIGVVIKLVSKEVFEKYDRNLLTFAIRSMSGTVWCPLLDCQQPAQVFSVEPHLGKCSVCLFVFCMDCKKASHGNVTCENHGILKNEVVDAVDAKGESSGETRNKDFEIFQTLFKKQGGKKTQEYLQKTISEIFGHLSQNEQQNLRADYVNASAAVKEKYHDEYGKAYLEYFLTGMMGTGRRTNYSASRFSDFLLTLKNENHETPSYISDGEAVEAHGSDHPCQWSQPPAVSQLLCSHRKEWWLSPHVLYQLWGPLLLELPADHDGVLRD